MEKTNLKKMPFKPPTLTHYGTLCEISEPFWSWEPPMMERPTARSGLSGDRTAKRRDEGWSRSRLLESMQLRDCPLMSHRGSRNWPLTWNKTDGGSLAGPYETLRGEIGTLKQVILSKIEPYNTCHLLIEFRGMRYVGTLVFDDATFCRQLCELLQNHHLGKSIKEIGDVDVGRFL